MEEDRAASPSVCPDDKIFSTVIFSAWRGEGFGQLRSTRERRSGFDATAH